MILAAILLYAAVYFFMFGFSMGREVDDIRTWADVMKWALVWLIWPVMFVWTLLSLYRRGRLQ